MLASLLLTLFGRQQDLLVSNLVYILGQETLNISSLKTLTKIRIANAIFWIYLGSTVKVFCETESDNQ